MRDLIAIIESKRSESQKRIVIRIFEGTVKILKSGVLSSTFLKTDVFSNFYNNFLPDEISRIRKFLENPLCIGINRNSYSVDVMTFKTIAEIFENNRIFFFERIKKGRRFQIGYFPIKKIQFAIADDFSISREENTLTIQYSTKQKSNIQTESQNELQVIVPTPELYILTEGKSPICKLTFRYENISLNAFATEEIITNENTRYLRNKGEENRVIDLLSSLGFVRQNGKFRYKGKDSFLTVAEKLLEDGFALFDTNEKPVKSSKSFSCNVSYGIDWFNVSLSHEGTELSSFVYDNINLKSKFFEFNGEKYLIPETLEKHKDSIKEKDGKLIIEKDDLLSALELNSELEKTDIANFENIFKKKTPIELTEEQKRILRPYQVDGVNFLERLKSNGFGALLADDMGLGKTLQAITFLAQTKRKNCAFAVVPKSLLENWRNEVEKFAPTLKVLIYHGADRKEKQDFGNYDIVLSTYATTMLDIDFLSKKKFSAVVFDEVQTIKNYKSKMYEAAFALNADFKMALSGTPFENNVLELWSVMRLLNPKIFANRGFFTRAVATEQFDRIKKAIAPFMLQRKKKDVLKDLPEKTEETIFCTMDETMSSCYSALHAKIIEQINGIEGKSSFFTASLILESLMKLRQFCCHPSLLPKGTLPIEFESSAKFDALKIKVQSLVEQKEKVIIFSQFTSMLKIIQKWLRKEKIKTFYLDGATNNRQDLVDEFEKSEDGVFLISLKAGGVGLNLVSCHYMFIYDPWWNPASESQAADRIYRIGQKNNVFIYRLITKNTIEEKVLSLQQKKSEIAKSIFDGLSAEKLTAEDLMTLLG